MSLTVRAPLRIGVIAHRECVPDWLATAIQESAERGIGELVVVATARVEQSGDHTSHALRRPRRAALSFRLLRWLDDQFLRQSRTMDHPLSEWAGHVPRLPLTVTPMLEGVWLASEDINRLRQQRLDVLIQAWSGRLLAEELDEIATYGVWWLHHGDDRTHRGGPPGVWEVLEDRTTTGVTLRRHALLRQNGIALARTVAKTRRFSFARNVEALYSRSARILVRSLQRARQQGDPRQPSVADESSWDAYAAPLYGEPTNRDILRLMPRVMARFVTRRIQQPRGLARWNLAWHFEPGVTGSAPNGALFQYREIAAPRGHFWADPFVVRDQDRWWLFFEDFAASARKGVICVCEIGPAGPMHEPRVALEAAQHLSYPYVFGYGGDWFMLPETKAAGRIALYRATQFPFEWALDRVLIDGVTAVDATLHEANGKWYLFTSVAERGIDSSEELHLFVADSPFGPFAEHPGTPIVTDVRRARMAGRLFSHQGQLYRPAQLSVPFYGSAVVVHQVLRLTPDEYVERPAYEMLPTFKRGVIGMHTINAMDGLSVIDLFHPG